MTAQAGMGIACSEKGMKMDGFGNEKTVASGNESG